MGELELNKKILIIGSIFLIVLVGIGFFAINRNDNKEDIAVSAMAEPTVEPTEEIDSDVEPVEEIKEEPVTEVKEEVVELTEVEKIAQEFGLTLFKEDDVLLKYTNTSSNIRKTPDKDGEKLTSLPINTEVSVLGITTPENKADEWSLIQLSIKNTDTYCFIKSSLLSDTKTEVKKPTQTSPQSNQSKGATPQTTTPSTPSTPSDSQSREEANQAFLDAIGGSTERDNSSPGIIF